MQRTIMLEQLRYLLEHIETCQREDCRVCNRMELVLAESSDTLLAPFKTKRFNEPERRG
jgi:hypothetical protein